MRLKHFPIRSSLASPHRASAFFVRSLVGARATILPGAQYPECPPTVKVTTSYPGASAETVAAHRRNAASNRRLNGDREYALLNSQYAGDRQSHHNRHVSRSARLKIAHMLTENRVQDVLTRLPRGRPSAWACRSARRYPHPRAITSLAGRVGAETTRYNLSKLRDLHIRECVARMPGVGDVQFQGGREICDAELARPGQKGGGLRSHRTDVAPALPRAKSSGLGRHLETAADPE